MTQQKMHCPKCGELISIDDVLTHQIEEKIKREQAAIFEKKEQIFAETLKKEKLILFKEAKKEAEREQNAMTALLEEQLKNKEERLAQLTQNEIQLRKEKAKLQEETQAFELAKTRELEREYEESKKKYLEEAKKNAAEAQDHIIAQLHKQLDDSRKTTDDLKRKLEQGSQQTQGEALELKLEEILTTAFLYDKIMPVPKGVQGADIIQQVINHSGHICGQIIWEIKQTKRWDSKWIQKLKEDQRASKSDIAVIASTALPDDLKGFAFREGVWICDVKLIIALATALRINLESITREKTMSVGKNEKMEVLYSYITSIEFTQRVEAILEAFNDMDIDLKKERLAYEKIWAKREKQIQKVLINTVRMHGSLDSLVALPEIKMLTLCDE